MVNRTHLLSVNSETNRKLHHNISPIVYPSSYFLLPRWINGRISCCIFHNSISHTSIFWTASQLRTKYFFSAFKFLVTPNLVFGSHQIQRCSPPLKTWVTIESCNCDRRHAIVNKYNFFFQEYDWCPFYERGYLGPFYDAQTGPPLYNTLKDDLPNSLSTDAGQCYHSIIYIILIYVHYRCWSILSSTVLGGAKRQLWKLAQVLSRLGETFDNQQ